MSEGASSVQENTTASVDLSSSSRSITKPAGMETRSGRVSRVPEQINIDAFAVETYLNEREIEDTSYPPSILAMAASANPDILYYHEAMKAPDREKFLQAMEQEVKTHSDGRHWEVVPRTAVPADKRVLPSVWAMRRKRRLDTQEVYKWKARLNVHGGKQKYGVDYWETYSPVVQWTTTRLFLILSVLRGWNCRQLDFVAAYPQAPSDTETYMEFPKGIKSLGNPNTHVLRLLQNIYGKKQSGRVWNIYMTDRLVKDLGFKQSKIDECVFYQNKSIILIYVDDVILVGPDDGEIDAIVKSMAGTFKITDE